MNQSQKDAIKAAHMALFAVECARRKRGLGDDTKLGKQVSNAIDAIDAAFDGYLILKTRITPHDFTLADHGTIFLLRPCSNAAQAWIEAHLPDDTNWFGPAVAIEHRYIQDILCGIAIDGLTFQQV